MMRNNKLENSKINKSKTNNKVMNNIVRKLKVSFICGALVTTMMSITACADTANTDNSTILNNTVMQENDTISDNNTTMSDNITVSDNTSMSDSSTQSGNTEDEKVQNNDTLIKDNKEDNMIKLIFDGGEVTIKLDDNSAAKDLVSRLPLTIKFDDFNNTEKISYLDSALDISDTPDECKPEAGDFAYYIPWGNLSLFYKEFRQSPQLAPLGTVQSGMEYLDKLDQYSSVTIELCD